MDPLVGVFTLDESTVRAWLADPATAPWHVPDDVTTWTPQDPGAEQQVAELLAAAQQHRHLTGPGEVVLLFTPDPDGDVFRYLLELSVTSGALLRLATPAYPWEALAPEEETGIEAAVTILGRAVTEANTELVSCN
ncbi:hypothetical protein [Actinomadura sp. SCN-SB]|uniref:hypothetical protein n=1 Tax=Actinomadura sp. SCN-SB TaxID=3373092 RepID=UPI0037521B93